MLELHCHTTYSDGTLTPTALVEAAIAAGVSALAITDHDSIGGWAEAQAAAAGRGLEIVPGLELSTTEKGRSLHLLGFYPDPQAIQPTLSALQTDRQRRAAAMVEKLRRMGYPIDLPQLSSHSAPGRPHIAQALVAAGHANSTEQAFKKWLKDGGLAYVPYNGPNAAEGIALLRSAGAVPVWAHPCLFKGATLDQLLPELVQAGLMGLEVYHPSHSPKQKQQLLNYCKLYGLLASGGSDYHGPSPQLAPGHQPQLNTLKVPAALLKPIQTAAAQLKGKNSSEGKESSLLDPHSPGMDQSLRHI
jgi:3',5'-nucleoside bisphosphate phosphatase